MNELNEIYEMLVELGLCKTQIDFSVNWLGKSPTYFAYLKSSGQGPALAAIGTMIGRLQSICPTSDDSRYWVERRRIREAIRSAKVMWEGEYELAYVPPWWRVTAIG